MRVDAVVAGQRHRDPHRRVGRQPDAGQRLAGKYLAGPVLGGEEPRDPRRQIAVGFGEIERRGGAVRRDDDIARTRPLLQPGGDQQPVEVDRVGHGLHAVIGAGDEQDVLARRVEPPHGLENLPHAAIGVRDRARGARGEPSGEWWPL